MERIVALISCEYMFFPCNQFAHNYNFHVSFYFGNSMDFYIFFNIKKSMKMSNYFITLLDLLLLQPFNEDMKIRNQTVFIYFFFYFKSQINMEVPSSRNLLFCELGGFSASVNEKVLVPTHSHWWVQSFHSI